MDGEVRVLEWQNSCSWSKSLMRGTDLSIKSWREKYKMLACGKFSIYIHEIGFFIIFKCSLFTLFWFNCKGYSMNFKRMCEKVDILFENWHEGNGLGLRFGCQTLFLLLLPFWIAHNEGLMEIRNSKQGCLGRWDRPPPLPPPPLSLAITLDRWGGQGGC